MKSLLLTLLFFTTLVANDKARHYSSTQDCKECHVKIYSEFSGSMHANSTPQRDPIHKSVWDKHPKNLKFDQYSCGKCHTPAANNLDDMKQKGKRGAVPKLDNPTHQEGISCAYCHRIKDIEFHKKSNTNIMTSTEKNFYGTREKHIESPFHGIVTDGNEHMKNGNVCIGCHSHKMNKHKLDVCSTNIKNEMDGANCVSCHMPKVDGSVSSLHKTKQHTFHGFAGAHSHSHMLTQYVDISMLRQIDNFVVNIDNRTSHALLLHPLRVAVLKVTVMRDNKSIKLKDEIFVRVIGHNGKPAMPWKASTTLKDTMIQANEKRSIKYDFKLQKGDRVTTILGWYLVNPKAIKKLKLDHEEVATKFKEFKRKIFNY